MMGGLRRQLVPMMFNIGGMQADVAQQMIACTFDMRDLVGRVLLVGADERAQ